MGRALFYCSIARLNFGRLAGIWKIWDCPWASLALCSSSSSSFERGLYQSMQPPKKTIQNLYEPFNTVSMTHCPFLKMLSIMLFWQGCAGCESPKPGGYWESSRNLVAPSDQKQRVNMFQRSTSDGPPHPPPRPSLCLSGLQLWESSNGSN